MAGETCCREEKLYLRWTSSRIPWRRRPGRECVLFMYHPAPKMAAERPVTSVRQHVMAQHTNGDMVTSP